MTKDNLENFIRNNRDDFDTIEPSSDLWNGIAGKINIEQETITLRKVKRIHMTQLNWVTKIAAAVLIFIGSYYFHDFRSNSKQIALQNTEESNPQLYNTLMEAEYYYTAQIGKEKEKLYHLTAGNSIVREEIQDELKELDIEFRELKEDLKDNADNEDIITAMIQNYRLKLRILQDMMLQLQQDKKVKNTDDEIKRIQI
jgi:hypothetical protein